MLDTLMIGTSGLMANAKGLRVIGNNLANVNTPGYKGATQQFGSLFEQQGGQAAPGSADNSNTGLGYGVATLGSKINFVAGTDQATGNPLDVALNGNGFYTVKRDNDLLYTRAGDFQFNAAGLLVNSAGDHVQGLDADHKLTDISLASLGNSLPKATSVVAISGNLTSTVSTIDPVLNSVTVIDASGQNHVLGLSFHADGAGVYTVTVKDATNAVLGTGQLKFVNGQPAADANTVSFALTPAGGVPMTVKLDFATNVTNLLAATSLNVISQDGYQAGVRNGQTIGADGSITVRYSNGKTAVGGRIALASFTNNTDLDQVSGSNFTLKPNADVQYGFAQTSTFGSLVSGHREGSNVDLAEEFSNLIVMQRGYQAASHVISTANDMIQELFDMKGRR
jgi:flagellar hook protein FlgE